MLVGLIIPAILVAFLGSLYILLPRGSGERVSYLATILLTEIMFSVMITQVVPEAKIVPTIAILFLELTVMLIVITITVLIIDKIQVILNKKMEAFT
jgi:hypothetical protein